jgi:cytochrome c oxidase subunit II
MAGAPALATALALAACMLLLRSLHAASTVSVAFERTMARFLLIAFALVIVWGALDSVGKHLPAPARPRVARRAILWLPLLLAAGGALRPATHGPDVHGLAAYGPLTVWPALQVAIPPLGLNISVGSLILGLAAAAALAIGWEASRVRMNARPSAARRAWLASPLALHALCLGCGPGLAVLGVATLTPWTQASVDPTGPWPLLLAPGPAWVALWAVAWPTRRRTWRRPRPGRLVLTAALAALVLAPAAQAFAGLPRGASERQHAIYELFIWTTIGAAILTLLVVVLVLAFSLRYRDRPGAAPDRPALSRAQRHTLNVAMVAVPTLVIVGLGVVSYDVLRWLDEVPSDGINVDVTGTQFDWQFRHPDGRVLLNELQVTEGQVVILNVTSEDVIHSLFIPDLGVKLDATPGSASRTWFQANRPGTYEAFCVEYCGLGHSEMRAIVVVQAAPP